MAAGFALSLSLSLRSSMAMAGEYCNCAEEEEAAERGERGHCAICEEGGVV